MRQHYNENVLIFELFIEYFFTETCCNSFRNPPNLCQAAVTLGYVTAL